MSVAWRQVVPAVLVAFLLGAAAGSWAQRVRGPRRAMMPPPPHHVVRRLDRELKLDASQREAVLRLLESRRPDAEALHKETFEKMEGLRRSVAAEIRALLTPEQQARFDALGERMAAKRRRHWGRR